MSPGRSIRLTPSGEFSFEEAAGFSFGPRTPDADGDRLRLVFVCDDLTSTLAAVVRPEPDGSLRCELAGSGSDEQARTQIGRILALDHDATEWRRVADSDPKLAELRAKRPGARPVLFHSPYEAAAWSIISLRRGRTQGQNLRARIADALGEKIEIEGETLTAFPTPERLLEADSSIQGLDPNRAERVRGVARAALEGELEPELLRSMEPEQAIEHLTRIDGLGPYYAGLVLVRSSGTADALPVKEKKLLAATARLYGKRSLTDSGLAKLAERWRPFRTWAGVLIRTSSDRDLF
ncbi:DNA-3-methyladenine glycosylase 2 family protein [Thermoleophilia bacterium SCSIO 60948]|nr:DNA-3-methyladenine glycosylase 2 family protein [Thermoleophilia bacterium SCSIO 60948]